jgi:hypothetical protein
MADSNLMRRNEANGNLDKMSAGSTKSAARRNEANGNLGQLPNEPNVQPMLAKSLSV